MNILLKNIFWHFRYYLLTAIIFIFAIVIAVQRQKGSEQAIRSEQVKQQLEESSRLAEESNRQSRVVAANQVAESNHLAMIQNKKIVDARAALQKAADDLKAYRIRYLGENYARYSIAIIVADENGLINQSLGQSLCTILDTNGLTTTASLFTPAFIADGLFNQMISGSKEGVGKLDLGNVVQNVLLARQSVEYATNSDLDGLITAKMTFDISAFSTSGFQLLFANGVKVAGPGLTRLEARTMAEERVIKQLNDGRLGKIQKSILTEQQ